MPHFRLAHVLFPELIRQFIIGMHLHRKVLPGVNEFQQQGKPTVVCRSGAYAKEPFPVLFQQLMQRPARKRSFAYHTSVGGMIRNHPGLAYRFTIRNRLVQHAAHLVTAPDALHETFFKFKKTWYHFYTLFLVRCHTLSQSPSGVIFFAILNTFNPFKMGVLCPKLGVIVSRCSENNTVRHR
ncbi:MAG: hypothetical protein BWY09_01136 [Candidatus Hydrogenedentes bacterium ADurb.Bin179]|nr:MAG: hypothetical protein BWY09_01136 [Candidatus Hydrogenedentes bacterium ADurb.Bin179]